MGCFSKNGQNMSKTIDELVNNDFEIKSMKEMKTSFRDLKSMGYKISNNYLYEFYDHCNAVFLTQSIDKFDYSEIKQAKSEKKTYVIDTGLLSAIEFSVSKNNGKLFENMVS